MAQKSLCPRILIKKSARKYCLFKKVVNSIGLRFVSTEAAIPIQPCVCVHARNSVYQFHAQQEIWVQAVTGKGKALECNCS